MTTTTIAWRELVELEPRLLRLYNAIRAVKDDKRRPMFCANMRWYGFGPYEDRGCKERMVRLVGYTDDRHDEPRLRTPGAYSVAYDKLYNALPDCRDCGRVSTSEFIWGREGENFRACGIGGAAGCPSFATCPNFVFADRRKSLSLRAKNVRRGEVLGASGRFRPVLAYNSARRDRWSRVPSTRSSIGISARPRVSVNLVLTLVAEIRCGDTGPNGSTMKGSSVALLVSLISLVGCAGHVELPFKNAVVVDHLEGNYQRLARCTYEHLARQQAQLSMSDLREQETVRIALTKAPQTYWELSFVNEDGGRQTRLELTSGSYPGEHALALARACAA